MNRRDVVKLAPALLLTGCQESKNNGAAALEKRLSLWTAARPNAAAVPKLLSADKAKLQGHALFILLASLYVPNIAAGEEGKDNGHIDKVLAKVDSTGMAGSSYDPAKYNVNSMAVSPLYAKAYDNIHGWLKGLSKTEIEDLNRQVLITLDTLSRFVNAGVGEKVDYPEGNPDNCLGQETGENLAHYGMLTPKP